jgi:hypothetical protein
MNRVVESYSNEPPLSDVANFFAASAAQIRIKAHMGFETGCEEGRKSKSFVCFCDFARTPWAQFDKYFENMNNFKGRN